MILYSNSKYKLFKFLFNYKIMKCNCLLIILNGLASLITSIFINYEAFTIGLSTISLGLSFLIGYRIVAWIRPRFESFC